MKRLGEGAIWDLVGESTATYEEDLKAVARKAEDKILKQVVDSIQVILDSEWVSDVKLGLIELLQEELKAEVSK